jgi:small Trp-rich protein
MWFVLVGVLMLVLRFLDVEPVASLSAWWVALPFALAVAWWQFSDASGLTRKREMDKLDARKAERRERNMVAMGMSDKRTKRTKVFRDRREADTRRVEAEREDVRRKNKDAVSSFHPSSQQGGEGPGKGPRG